jgi:hypothetical protein
MTTSSTSLLPPKFVPLTDLDSRMGTIVPGVQGVLSKIGKHIAGIGKTDKKIPYSFQHAFLTADGVTVKVTFKDRKELPRDIYEGKPIAITSYLGKRGLSGVGVKQEEYKGETQLVLWVTPTASTEVDAPAANRGPEPRRTGDQASEADLAREGARVAAASSASASESRACRGAAPSASSAPLREKSTSSPATPPPSESAHRPSAIGYATPSREELQALRDRAKARSRALRLAANGNLEDPRLCQAQVWANLASAADTVDAHLARESSKTLMSD